MNGYDSVRVTDLCTGIKINFESCNIRFNKIEQERSYPNLFLNLFLRYLVDQSRLSYGSLCCPVKYLLFYRRVKKFRLTDLTFSFNYGPGPLVDLD